MNTKTKPKITELELDFNSLTKQKNIQVAEDAEKGMVTLKIYGSIEEPEEYIEELTKLETLSKTHEVLELTLNSPGGSLNTTVDIASIIKNFTYVITIGKGEVASGAFMLWTMGNVRVVTDYSMYMAHRESYGMYAKTTEHRDAAKTFGMVYEEMFENCFGDLLTQEEKNIAERSETWISYKDLLKRDRVISHSDYTNAVNPVEIVELYVTETGKTFILDEKTEAFRSVELIFGDEIISDMTSYMFGMTKITKIESTNNVDIVEKKILNPGDNNVKLLGGKNSNNEKKTTKVEKKTKTSKGAK